MIGIFDAKHPHRKLIGWHFRVMASLITSSALEPVLITRFIRRLKACNMTIDFLFLSCVRQKTLFMFNAPLFI
jgi:hypothetical protein